MRRVRGEVRESNRGGIRPAMAERRRVTDAECLGAMQVLLDLGMSRAARPPQLTPGEQRLVRSLGRKPNTAALAKRLDISAPRLAYMCVRIIHAHRAAPSQ